jgi:hypothetical protein
MASQWLSVLRGPPSESASQVGQRVTRCLDAWASPLNQTMAQVTALQDRWRGSLEKHPTDNLVGGTMYHNSKDSKVYIYIDDKVKWLALN